MVKNIHRLETSGQKFLSKEELVTIILAAHIIQSGKGKK
jgi:DNA repair protein RadC